MFPVAAEETPLQRTAGSGNVEPTPYHPPLAVPASSIILLTLALFLLFFPRNWLRLGKRVTAKPLRKYNQTKVERDPYDQTMHPLVEAAKSRNWVDFFRALIGVAVVAHVAEQHGGGLGQSSAALPWVALALALAVIAQMIRLEGRLSLFAPIFYLQGLTIGLAGGVIGLFTMLVTWALTPVLPSPGALLFVQGAATLCLTLLLSDTDVAPGILLAGLAWLPMLISVLLRRRLAAVFDKRQKIIPRDARTN